HDAAPALVDEGVGGTEVDGEVAGHRSAGPVGAVAVLVGWSERPHLAREGVDAGVEPVRRAVLPPEDARAARRHHDHDQEEDERAHGADPPPPSARCWASRPQLSPPSHRSRFQIGTVRFSSSIANRAASKASARWGDDTETTTAASPTSSTPV